MSTPQDPFAAPGGEPPPSGQPPAYGQAPTYGQPPAYGQAPTYGQPPAYGQAPAYGQQGFFAPPSGGQSLASWLQRVGATLVDLVISAVLQLIVGLVSPSLGRLAGFALALYFAYLVGTTGQTPGKRALGIKVLREQDGQLLGAGAGIGRAFLHILDLLPFGLGYLWPLWDAKKQTFADKAIHSVVVKL